MDISQLARVHTIVRSIVPRWLDSEQIAIDILMESWANHIDNPTYRFISNRCIDYLRREQLEKRTLHAQRPAESTPAQTTVETAQLVDTLMSVLSNEERKVIYYRFYRDYTIDEISNRTRIDTKKVREVLEVAIYKMKQASQYE